MNWLIPAWERDQFLLHYTRDGDDIVFRSFPMWLAYTARWAAPASELALTPRLAL